MTGGTIRQITSVFETKKATLEGQGGMIIKETDEHVEMVFPDGTGCTLTYLGRVDWFKAA